MGDMLCKVGSLSPLRGFCFVVSMSGGSTPACNLTVLRTYRLQVCCMLGRVCNLQLSICCTMKSGHMFIKM